jgi:hypothetical protein
MSGNTVNPSVQFPPAKAQRIEDNMKMPNASVQKQIDISTYLSEHLQILSA